MPSSASGPSSSRSVRRCWAASTSVGASSAAWPPASTTWSMARSATTVLPEPTSPCSRRCIGCSAARSAAISAPTSRCPAVSVNGSRASNASSSPPPAAGRATPGRAAASARRRASAACRTKASSYLSLRCPRRQSSSVYGSCTSRSASSRPGQPEAGEQLTGQRVGQVGLGERVEHGAHGALDAPGGQRRGGRVDRDRPGGLHERRGLVVDLGAHHLVVGVGELDRAAVELHRAGEHPQAPWPQPALVHAQRAGALAEERQGQLPGAVGHHGLHEHAAARAHRAHGGAAHLGHHGDVLAGPQLGQVRQAPRGGVAARVVPQEVADGVQAQSGERSGGAFAQQPLEGLGPAGPDHPTSRRPRPAVRALVLGGPRRSATLARLSGRSRTCGRPSTSTPSCPTRPT